VDWCGDCHTNKTLTGVFDKMFLKNKFLPHQFQIASGFPDHSSSLDKERQNKQR